MDLDPAVAGWFQCTAYNTAGSIATRARVVVDTPPPTQQTEGGAPRIVLPAHTRVIQPE